MDSRKYSQLGRRRRFLTAYRGILIPYVGLPAFYKDWVYWVNPLQWLVRGILEAVMHDLPVRCSPQELVKFTPPLGETCAQYAGDWLRTASGYIVDENATGTCEYCVFKSGDEYLATINARLVEPFQRSLSKTDILNSYSTKWRDLGVFAVYIFSNIALIYILYFAFREYRWGRLFARLRGRKASN